MGIFILWRLLLFIPLVAAAYLIPLNPPVPVSYVYNFKNFGLSFNSVFLFPWANFDGIHYFNIAEFGYTNQARFFPLFPILIKLLSTNVIASLLLVSILFLLALFIFKRLIEIDFPKSVSKKVLILLLIFPTSFFFVSIYSEGLFLFLTLLVFYFARKKMWLFSISCALLLTATRFVGIAILPALLYEYFVSGKIVFTKKNIFMLIKKLTPFLIVPAGLIFYSLFNLYEWNNLFYFIQAQGELGNSRSVSGIVLFPQTVFRYFKILTSVPANSYDWMIALLELISFLFTAFMLYFAWKKKLRRSYLIFAFINFAITISTGTFSGLPRYIITIFPIFMALALLKNKILKLSYIIISPILLFILLMLFSRGYFVA